MSLNQVPSRRTPAGAPSVDEQWKLAQRVASSPLFHRSPRLREFLLYICDCALNGRIEEITEQKIGHGVFGRTRDYNPADDNIVRVEARHLRKKLAEYFEQSEDEPIVISVPKGSYIPAFGPRSSALEPAVTPVEPAVENEPPATEAPAPLDLEIVTPLDPPIAEARPPRRLKSTHALVALLVLVSLAAAWLVYQNATLRRALSQENGSAVASTIPWAAVLDESHQTRVVLADSCLALTEFLTSRTLTLTEYLNHQFLPPQPLPPDLRGALEVLMTRQYTSVADVEMVGRLGQLARPFSDRLTIKYARNMDIRDFKHDHAILLGTKHANPWVELFERDMNFRFRFNLPLKRAIIENVKPLAGEPPEFGASLHSAVENYSVIALVPNLSQTGNVLIVEGSTMEGTEAAGDFIASREFASDVAPRLGWKPGSKPPYFELLIKSQQVGGSSSSTSIVSLRVRR